VIGTNKKDAQETVKKIFEDLTAGAVPEREPVETPIEEILAERAADHVTYLGWQAIDRAEIAAGEPHGRPRIKFCRIDEMVDAARSADPVAG
jgi:ferredoxin/flavodoxin---NADP+ reductase